MIRFSLSIIAVGLIAACTPEVPDSSAGVGFTDYSIYQQQRETRLVGTETNVLPPNRTAQSAGATSVPTQVAAAAEPASTTSTGNSAISDEQSFEAVTARETIESDRERLAAQREQYKFIEPQPLPQRTGAEGPNIVQYAITTTNAVGQPIYRRSGSKKPEVLARHCAKYGSSDLAQAAFLKAGGPKRDPKGLDPDGDGFACYWDPTPFRLAVNR